MNTIDCVSGCLRHELDEMQESLAEKTEAFTNGYESADNSRPSPAELDRFSKDINDFAENLVLFEKNCSRCRHFKTAVKILDYQAVLKLARDLREILS